MRLTANDGLFAIESIATQTDRFGQKLESLIGLIHKELQDDPHAEISDRHVAIRGLEEAIFGRLGLRVGIITNEHAAAILPFYSNRNHVFLPEFIRGHLNIRDQTKLLRTMEERKGSVNLEKAELSGIFSEYVHPLYMNFFFLVKVMELTPEQITAVLLHELGHGFYSCYYSDRSDRTNQVFASISRHLMKEEVGDIEYVYRELTKITPSITKGEVDKMLNGPKVVAGATWFKVVMGVVKSQTIDDTYNKTSFEQRADNFATRFGYGKHLLLALDVLSKHSIEKAGKGWHTFAHMTSVLFMMVGALLVFSLISTGSVGLALFFGALKFVTVLAEGENIRDYTYDRLKFRYQRVRQDAIDQLKNTKLKSSVVKDYLEQIYTMDEIIKSTSVFKSIDNRIANFIFSGAREAEASITDQQLMETLASNDLFVQAAAIRHS